MNILVTVAKGMVGRALCANLKNIRNGKNRTRPNIQIDENIIKHTSYSPTLTKGVYCKRLTLP